jgi:AraC-like DNA-binding protein
VSFKCNRDIADIWQKLLPAGKEISDIKLYELFEQINEGMTRNAAQEEYTAILFNIMAVLRAPQKGGILSENDAIIERTHSFITQNLNRNLTLEDIAAEAGFSATHFSRLFKKRYGMAVNEYIIGRRIAKAQLLLAQTALTVKEISYKCGFSDQLYFSRMFKKKLKITPVDFRKYYRQRLDS